MPTYNGASYIEETLNSIFNQSLQDFEIVISDDCSTDDTVKILKGINDSRFKIFLNDKNLGYGRNLQVIWRKASSDIIFLMGQDDILLKDALLNAYNAFSLDRDVGVITRPYYWFDTDFRKPVRAVKPFNPYKDSVISIFDGNNEFYKIFESVGQLSGLAYLKKYIEIDFHEDTFPAHIYPFAGITREHKVVFLKDYIVAVRIESSQTRFKTRIYDVPPTLSWVNMFKSVFREEKFNEFRKKGIKQISKNFVGLIQIKNYSTIRNLLREILILIKIRPLNLLDPRFWFFSISTLVIPRRFLIYLVDKLKGKVLSRGLKDIVVNY